jgi:predicted transcriptional regulator of viral defense system
MRTTRTAKKLNDLLKKPLFTAAEAREAGVHPSLLSYYVKKGLLERIDRGIYRASETTVELDFVWEDLILAAKSIPSGVVCLISALALHDLTDEIPRVHWIAVPHASRAPKRTGVKVIRMRNMTLGRTTFVTGDQSIPVFDRERTIVDAFRYLGNEAAIKALKIALEQKGANRLQLTKLQDYAKALKVNLAPYLLAMTT